MIKYSQWGLASTNGRVITLHKGLQKREWWGLRGIIIRHEKRHHQGPYDMEDLRNDFKDEDEMPTLPLIMFMLTHLTSLSYFIPTDHKLKLKPSQIIFWSTVVAGLLFGWYMLP